MRTIKRLAILMVMCVLLITSLIPGVFAAKTVPSGYTAISTPEQLDNIRNNLSGKYILTANIDLTAALAKGGSLYDANGWIAIGYLSSSSNNPFTGILDGNGYTISGFSAKGASGVAHLIHTNQGTVKNLTISGTSSRGGVFCGTNKGLLQNCHNKVTITTSVYTSSELSYGGLVNGNSAEGIVELCSNQASITGDVYSNGGMNDKALRIGGIVGSNSGIVRKCYNTGSVRCNGNSYTSACAAGIVGYGNKDSLIENCYNAGSIYAWMKDSGYSSAYNVDSAGILGTVYYQYGTKVKYCYNVGSVTMSGGYHNKYLGAIAGYPADSSFTKCYYLTGSCSQATYNGERSSIVKLTENQMRTQSAYTDFDFSKVWTMGSGSYRYPVFRASCTHAVDKINATAASCTSDGNITYWHCNVCNKYFSSSSKTTEITYASTVIPGHNWTEQQELEERLVAGTGTNCQSYKKYYVGCTDCDAVSTSLTFTGTTTGDHQPADSWSFEKNTHFHSCTVAGCGYKADVTACQGGTASCTAKPVCATCNNAYGSMLEHNWTEQLELEDRLVPGTGADCQSYKQYYIGCIDCEAVSNLLYFTGSATGSHKVSAAWSFENDTHFHSCTVAGCDLRENVAVCSGGTVSCTAKAVCDVCKNGYGSVLEHSWTERLELEDRLVPGTGSDCRSYKSYYVGCTGCDGISAELTFMGNTTGAHVMSPEWYFEKDTHFRICTVDGCNAKGEVAACGGGTATCAAKAVCATCKNIYGSLLEHSWTAKQELEERLVPGTGTDCQSKKVYYVGCVGCGAKNTELTFTGNGTGSHQISDGWYFENNTHFRICTVAGCGIRKDADLCSGGTATCTAKAICRTCKNSYGSILEHSWEDKQELEERLVPGTGENCQSYKVYYVGCSNCEAVSDNLTFISAVTGSHKMSSAWSYENGTHFHRCTVTGCENREDTALCAGGTATCTGRAVCSTCKYAYGSLLDHSWTEKQELEARLVAGTGENCQSYKEYYVGCMNCDAVSDSMTFTSTVTGAHKISASWSFANDTHYRRCTVTGCKTRENAAPCAGGKASCTAKAICSTCKNSYGSLRAHNWEDEQELEERQAPGTGENCQSYKEYYVGCMNCDAVSDRLTFTGSETGDHEISRDWYFTNDVHYRVCTIPGCNTWEDMGACSGGKASCTAKAICSTCKNSYGSLLMHSWEDKQELEARLVPDTGTDCQSYKEYYIGCTACDAVNTRLIFTGSYTGSHKMSADWTFENDTHFHGCTVPGCDLREDAAPCSGGTVSCTEKAVCSICKNLYGGVLGHSWEDKQELEARLVPGTGTHCQSYKEYFLGCTNCGALSDHLTFSGMTTGEHQWTPANCTTAMICVKCESTIGEALGHRESPWRSSDRKHWKVCEVSGCGVILEEAEHSDTDENGACDVCRYELPVTDAPLPGDMDGNGMVDEDDAVYLLQHILMPDLFPVTQPVDYDGNGVVDEDDAVYLLQHVLMPEFFPL